MAKERCQWAGAIAAVGGACWAAWGAATAVLGSQPTAVKVLIVVSGLGVVAGHYALEDFYGARMKRPGVGGAWLGAFGAMVFTVGQGIRLVTGNEGGIIIAIGVLALVAGSLMAAVGLVRTRIQPPWLGIALGVGTLAFLGFNVQPVTATLYGLAWVALGQDLFRFDPPDGRFGSASRDYGWLS